MKTVSIPINKIKPNPYRDLRLFPIDKDQVSDLKDSINEFGFFGGLIGRKNPDGFIELGFGHSRFEALKKTGATTVDIALDNLDDDRMVHLMVTENASQSGSNPAAIMNEVAAAMRRLVPIILEGDFVRIRTKYRRLFADKRGFETVRGKLLARIENPDKDGAIGHLLIIAYLGRRSESEIRQAIASLKQSAIYDDIVDAALADSQQQEFAKSPGKKSNSTAVVSKSATVTPRKRILDERTAAVFGNDHQFHAFREAVTTDAAKRFIPVENHLKLAKEIVGTVASESKNSSKKKIVSASFIKSYVNNFVNQAAKAQRNIDAEERRKFVEEQIGDQIKSQVKCAKATARSLIDSCQKLEKLWQENPGNPWFGDIGGTLGHLAQAIEQMRERFRVM